MRIRILIAIGLLFILSSCCKYEVKRKWDMDYYAYHMGAYINGIEFHEPSAKLFGPKRSTGFHMQKEDNMIYLNSEWHHVTLSDVNHDNGYGLVIMVAMDSSSFCPGIRYALTDSVDYDGDVSMDPSSGRVYDDISGQPITCPYSLLYLFDGDGFYFAKDGWISFGEFSMDGTNSEMVLFECSAVNEKGDTLHVKDGFINKYCENSYRY